MDILTGRWSPDVSPRSHFSAAADRRSVYTADTAMATIWPIVLALLLSGAADPDPAGGPGSRVRGLGTFVRSLIEDTAARSPTVRGLLTRLMGTDVIVYIEMTGTPEIPTARTKLVTAAPGVRFLRIGISLTVPFDD